MPPAWPWFPDTGGVTDDTKENLLKYFRLIDRGLHDLFEDERAPLVLAGVEYLFPIYREANTYPRLIEEGIPGNPQGIECGGASPVGPEDRQALFSEGRKRRRRPVPAILGDRPDLRRYPGDRPGRRPRTGRHALRRLGAPAMGNDSTRRAAPSNCTGKRETQGEDLLEIAAIQTFLNGGSVFILPPEKMPDSGRPGRRVPLLSGDR